MIAANTWKENRFITVLYVLLLESELVIAVFAWPGLRDETETLGPIRSLMPADFLKRMVTDVMSRDADVAYNAYMAIQMFF